MGGESTGKWRVVKAVEGEQSERVRWFVAGLRVRTGVLCFHFIFMTLCLLKLPFHVDLCFRVSRPDMSIDAQHPNGRGKVVRKRRCESAEREREIRQGRSAQEYKWTKPKIGRTTCRNGATM
eukprot:6199546-Pleurochrysis_carterae.AAC.1